MKTRGVLILCVMLLGIRSAFAAEPAGLPEPLKSALTKQFEGDDADKDGQVTKHEMFARFVQQAPNQEEGALRQLGAQVYLLFRRTDANSDETLSLDEVFADAIETIAHRDSLDPEERKLLESRFSQCSYNALASVLIHFHGSTPSFDDVAEIERQTFREPLNTTGFGDFHGWVPWTSYIINSGALEWNGPVRDLQAENFACTTAAVPVLDTQTGLITVRYAQGERAQLEAKMFAQMKRGPVLVWTPYAAVLSPVSSGWKHVAHVDDSTDQVPFGPFTHAVACTLMEDGSVLVVDGAVDDGAFHTDLRTIVATSSAMSAFVRNTDGGKRTPIIDSIRGITEDEFNVSVFRRTDNAGKPLGE